MPQAPTASTTPRLTYKAMGMNNARGELKLKPDEVPFSLNVTAQGDVWPRRAGRSMRSLETGAIFSMFQFDFGDGVNQIVAQVGASRFLYNITPDFTYFFGTGARIIFRSPDLTYWNCTPSVTTGLITPTIITTPSATPHATVTMAATQNMAFQATSGTTQLSADQDFGGWFTIGYGIVYSAANVTADWVFTTGKLNIIDKYANTWQFSINNSGSLTATTI